MSSTSKKLFKLLFLNTDVGQPVVSSALLSLKQLKADANGQHGIEEWSSRKWPIPGPFGPSLLGLGPGPLTFKASVVGRMCVVTSWKRQTFSTHYERWRTPYIRSHNGETLIFLGFPNFTPRKVYFWDEVSWLEPLISSSISSIFEPGFSLWSSSTCSTEQTIKLPAEIKLLPSLVGCYLVSHWKIIASEIIYRSALMSLKSLFF